LSYAANDLVNSQPGELETRPASSAELSLDISRIVSQVLTGQMVDTAQKGEELAAKYRNLGMSGAMIEDAISRAAGMMGMIRGGDAPVALGERTNDPAPAVRGDVKASAETPEAAALAAPADIIDAEFEALSFDPLADPATHSNGAVHEADAATLSAPQESQPTEPAASVAKGAVARLRRALFRG
jgi:hypothetical protein